MVTIGVSDTIQTKHVAEKILEKLVFCQPEKPCIETTKLLDSKIDDTHSFTNTCTFHGIVSCVLQVTLKLDEKELEHALQDKVLMSVVLKKGLPGK